MVASLREREPLIVMEIYGDIGGIDKKWLQPLVGGASVFLLLTTSH